MRRLALTALLAFALAAPAQAADHRPGEAERLAERAIASTFDRHRACRPGPRPAPRQPAVVDGEPSAPLREALGVFRRAPTEEELRLAEQGEGLFRDGALRPAFRQGVRVVTAEDGTRFTLLTGLTASFDLPAATLRRCQRSDRRALARLARGRTSVVQRRARRALGRIHRSQKAAPSARVEGLFMTAQRPGEESTGGTGVPFDAALFRRRGIVAAIGSERRGEAFFQLVVPDGVATVTAAYRDPARAYTGRVVDNVVSIPVRASVGQVLAASFTWRAADGTVVNAFRL